ncbi:hypothetical protein HDV05_000059 [Chytridiales sp. JEL 0842]|nr:hypothetical protein HDV05_000059 [Chytridiales sp. JEL 0842]
MTPATERTQTHYQPPPPHYHLDLYLPSMVNEPEDAGFKPKRHAMAGHSQEVLHSYQHLQERKTKIVGTLGPASIPKIRELILAGINVFRLNFSHISDPETQTPLIELIRKESAELGLPVAILGDLCGPKIRCNGFKDAPSITLQAGGTVRLVHSAELGDPDTITTPIPQIVGVLSVGHRVLLDDGAIALVVKERISADELICTVKCGGVLKPKKGINVPDIKVDLPALTEKDARDAAYMYKKRLDYIALSFVQKPEDVKDLLDLFEKLHKQENEDILSGKIANDRATEELEEDWRPHVIAKIEKPQALDVIDDIIDIADGIMVARGDLGVECSLEQVPLIQKTLIRKAAAAEKPVITATQMLESMINSPVPTRAEVSDVANAVFDGTDAVMLSAECATGLYPLETVQMMASICQNSEAGAVYLVNKGITTLEINNPMMPVTRSVKVSEFAHSIADAAVAAATEQNVSAMIVFTTSSEMAIFVSKRRPKMPIIAVTPSSSIYRRLSLLYGVHPVASLGLRVTSNLGTISKLKKADPSITGSEQSLKGPGGIRLRNTDAILALTEKDVLDSPSARKCGLKEGDPVVFCAGFHHPFPGLSNTIKMSRFGDSLKSDRLHGLWADSLQNLDALKAAATVEDDSDEIGDVPKGKRTIALGWHSEESDPAAKDGGNEQAETVPDNEEPVVADSNQTDGAANEGIANLRNLVKTSLPPKAKAQVYDFQYADRDTFEAEVNEFFNFQDNPMIQEGRELFEKSFKHDWKAMESERVSFTAMLLEQLELKSTEDRLVAAKKLLYISQGCFGLCNSKEDQIDWMKKNNRMLLDLGGFSHIHHALLGVSSSFDILARPTSGSPTFDHLKQLNSLGDDLSADRQSALDVANAETSIYLSLAYLVVDVNLDNWLLVSELCAHRGKPDADDTTEGSAKPPFAVYLFDLVASLAEGNRKNYPVKKLLLLLWKVLLATIGSADKLEKLKIAARKRESLPQISKDSYLKATPQDLENFHNIMLQRFPAYTIPDASIVSPNGLNLADPDLPCNSRKTINPNMITSTLQPFYPSSLKAGTSSLPTPIRETIDLLKRYMYISTGNVQMARERVNIERWEKMVMGQYDVKEKKGVKKDILETHEVESLDECDELLSRVENFLAAKLAVNIGMLVRLLYYVNIGHPSNNQGEAQIPTLIDIYGISTESLNAMDPAKRRLVLDRLDVQRHKEAVTKAVGAILVILLKAFKADHVLKFEYLCQLLADNNCTVLILKMISTWFQNPATVAKNAAASSVAAAADGTNNPDSAPSVAAAAASLGMGGPWLRLKEEPADLKAETQSLPDLELAEPELAETDEDEKHILEDREQQENLSSNISRPSKDADAKPVEMKEPGTTSSVCHGNWRSFFISINLLRILQKLTKRKTHRILALVQWKASAVLKRVIKVQNVPLQLYALKVLKSQISYLGRKWRGSNMKALTSIYLHLRPNCKEEYLSGEQEADGDEALAQEQQLRYMISAYHHRVYPAWFESPLMNETNAAAKGQARGRDSEHDELDQLLGIAPKASLIAQSDDMPAGRNIYAALGNEGLDANFMENYEQWLQEEVYGMDVDDESAYDEDDMPQGGIDTVDSSSLDIELFSSMASDSNTSSNVRKGWWAPDLHKEGHLSLDMGLLHWETEWPEKNADALRNKSESGSSSESGYHSGSLPDEDATFELNDDPLDDSDVPYQIEMNEFDESAPPSIANGVIAPSPSPATSPQRKRTIRYVNG